MGVNEGPWEKQHVAIISELQVESQTTNYSLDYQKNV